MARLSKTWFWLAVTVLTCASIFLGLWLQEAPEKRFEEHIRIAARKYNLEPALIKAVIWRESKFKPEARGSAGEIGLMQVREAAAFEWADAESIYPFEHEEITDPQKNILCGSYYLSKLMKRYEKTDNPIPYALADYNAGRTHVLRWNKGAAKTNSAVFLEQMDFPGTRQYAATVMERYSYYKKRAPSQRAGL